MSAVKVRALFARRHRNNFVMCLIKRRADEVVHACIEDDEVFLAVLLYVEHAGEERSGLGDEKTSGLEEELDSFESADGLFEGGGVLLDFFFGMERERRVVFDAESSACVEEPDGQPIFAKQLNESRYAAGGGSRRGRAVRICEPM